MTPLESELMKFIRRWRRKSKKLSEQFYDQLRQGKQDAISDMLTELELILSIEKEK